MTKKLAPLFNDGQLVIYNSWALFRDGFYSWLRQGMCHVIELHLFVHELSSREKQNTYDIKSSLPKFW